MSTDVLLQASAITKKYGKFVAVDKVSLNVGAGTIHSVIGPNGAGKTTLFHTLAGTVPLTDGSIAFAGRRIDHLPQHRRVQRGIARSFQVTSLFASLPVRENLRIAAQGKMPWQALKAWKAPRSFRFAVDLAEELLARLGLAGVADRAAGALAHAQQRRLEIGMAMAGRPKLIMLDEPSSGMGVNDIGDMKALIQGLRKHAHTVLLVEHNMDIVMNISDVITVMQQGRVLVEGRPDAIRSDERVRQAYLGNMITGGAHGQPRTART